MLSIERDPTRYGGSLFDASISHAFHARARAEMCGRLASAVQEPPLDLVEPSITHITVPQLANREAEDLGAIVAN